MLSRATRFSSLKRWALDVAKRRGLKRAKVALARKLATVLHRMWVDGAEFPLGQASVAPPRNQRRGLSERGQNGFRSPEVPLPGRGSGEAVRSGSGRRQGRTTCP